MTLQIFPQREHFVLYNMQKQWPLHQTDQMQSLSALQPYPRGTKNKAPNTPKHNLTNKANHHRLPSIKPERLDEKPPNKLTVELPAKKNHLKGLSQRNRRTTKPTQNKHR